MSAHAGASFMLPKPVLGYHPRTFLDRGVSVPFTTPHLNGARARPGPRGALEFTVPNPSGGRGIYIVPWEGVFALCRPTVHDTRLITVLSGLREVTPLAIRRAARAIAAEGLAGRAARSAAEEAIAIDEKSRMMANFQLLLELVGQVEARLANVGLAMPGTAAAGDAAQTIAPQVGPADLERRARESVACIASELRLSTEEIATSLEALAVLFANVGVGKLASASRVPRIVAALSELRAAMLEWARSHADESGGDATRVAEAAEVTLTCVRLVMAEVHALPRDMRALLRGWLDDPADMANRVARPDWLVDGWERIVLLWQTADMLGREITLAEMVGLIPALPQEVADWCRVPLPGPSEGTPRRGMVTMLGDWRTGVTTYDMIARNEQMLCLSP